MSTSSDTERREARRRKILENAELRMNKIIYSEGATNEQSWMNKEPVNRDQYSQNGSSPNFDNNVKKMCNDDAGSPQYVPISTFRRTKGFYEKPRTLLAILIAIVFRILLLKYNDWNVLIMFLPYEVFWELLSYRFDKERKPYPQHGLILDFFLSFGFPEYLVIIYGRATEVINRMLCDFVLVFLSFIFVHFVLSVF